MNEENKEETMNEVSDTEASVEDFNNVDVTPETESGVEDFNNVDVTPEVGSGVEDFNNVDVTSEAGSGVEDFNNVDVTPEVGSGVEDFNNVDVTPETGSGVEDFNNVDVTPETESGVEDFNNVDVTPEAGVNTETATNEKVNSEAEDKPKKNPIDKVFVGCIFLIILLTVIAVLPPMLRVFLPERYEHKPIPSAAPVSTPEESHDGTVVCTSSFVNSDVSIVYEERYTYVNDVVTRLELHERSSLVAGSTITIESLVQECEASSSRFASIDGYDVYCNDTVLDQVEKTQTIDYQKLDPTVLEDPNNPITLDYPTAPNKNDVLLQKRAAGFVCN